MSSQCRFAEAITGSCITQVTNWDGGKTYRLMRSRSQRDFGSRRIQNLRLQKRINPRSVPIVRPAIRRISTHSPKNEWVSFELQPSQQFPTPRDASVQHASNTNRFCRPRPDGLSVVHPYGGYHDCYASAIDDKRKPVTAIACPV